MKYEAFIHHIIKYNELLRGYISRELNKPMLQSSDDGLINELNWDEDLSSSALNLGVSPNEVFEELYNRIRTGLLGTTIEEGNTGRKKAQEANPGLFMEDSFFNLMAEWFHWENDQDVILPKLFNLKSVENFLRKGGLLAKGKSLPPGRLFGRFLEHHTTLKPFTKNPLLKGNLWRYLSQIMDSDVKEKIAENLICPPSEIFIALTSRLEPQSDRTLNKIQDESQVLGPVAIIHLKSSLRVIGNSYQYKLKDAIKNLLTTVDPPLASTIQSSYLFHIHKYNRLALEKILLPLKNDPPEFLKPFFTEIELGDGTRIDKIDSKLVRIFVVAGLRFPDPFGFNPFSSNVGGKELAKPISPVPRLMSPTELSKAVIASYTDKGDSQTLRLESWALSPPTEEGPPE